ncbi:LysR family transcriptional regulator [Clostridium sp. B9]|uniref:LysR family transcriptional regulator n=1 Tax=Clostridium sp. B9 TaxID=3423224 RepID=UPI003D2F13AE
MKFQQLVYIIEVVEKGSLNKAAESLYISQPNLSNSIKKLEEELNIKIFNRSNKGVVLTKEGRNFFDYAKSIVNQMEEIKHVFNTSEKKTSLRVASQYLNFTSDATCNLVKRFSDRDMDIYVKDSSPENIIRDISNGSFDIGIIIITDIQNKIWRHIFKVNKIEFNELLRRKPHIFLGESNEFMNKKELTFNDLKEYPFITIDRDHVSALNYNVERSLIDLEEIKKIIYVDDRFTYYKILRETNAYGIGFNWSKKVLDNNGIKAVPMENYDVDFTLGWIKRKDIELSEEAKIFINDLKSILDT